MNEEIEKKIDRIGDIICDIGMFISAVVVGILALMMSVLCAYDTLENTYMIITEVFLWIYCVAFLVLGAISFMFAFLEFREIREDILLSKKNK